MGLLEQLNRQKINNSMEKENNKKEETKEEIQEDKYKAFKKELQAFTFQILNESYDSKKSEIPQEDFIRKTIDTLITSKEYPIPKEDREEVINEVTADLIGLGPLEKLLKDDDITEIMVNGAKQIYIEQKGKLTLSNVKFEDDAQVMKIIDRIVSPLGRHVDESSPMVDARLKDGSRVNVIIPPLALNGPTITIRKFPKERLSAQNLINWGSATVRIMSFLEACVKGKCNVLISGGTGSGKTTLLNILSGYIPANERIVTMEDSAELQLQQEHVVRLESRPANAEGKGAIPIQQLVVNALRMRPDRIVVGECRGGEALDMLQAMNTGHDGSLTTGHANSARDMITRLETMVMMAGMELPERAIRQQIASAINIIVQQSRLPDGSRKITSVTEITGMEGNEVVLQDIFKFISEGKDENNKIVGHFVATGVRPLCIEKLRSSGINVKDDWFIKGNC